MSNVLLAVSAKKNVSAFANSPSNLRQHVEVRAEWYTVHAIGLYRDVWIAAIASSTTSLATRTAAICVRFQGRRVRRVYVTMQITFLTRKSALIYRRQRVASLTLNCNGDFAIRAYDASWLLANHINLTLVVHDNGNALLYPFFIITECES